MGYKLSQEQMKAVVDRAARALVAYCRANGIHYLVTGSSGGLDSAVTLGITQRACQIAAKQNWKLVSVGILMPCDSTPESVDLGRQTIQAFGAEEMLIDLSQIFQVATQADGALVSDVNEQIRQILERTSGLEALKEWDWSAKVAQGNIRARMRMMFGTYHVARMLKGMVLSTDNLSEFWMAFWTICGDVGDFSMIQNILKGFELYDIAAYLGVSQAIIDAKPDDGLGIAGGDEDQLGAPYEIVDRVMITLLQKGFRPDGLFEQLDHLPEVPGVSPEVVSEIARRCLAGEFKRHGTIMLSREQLGLLPIEEIGF